MVFMKQHHSPSSCSLHSAGAIEPLSGGGGKDCVGPSHRRSHFLSVSKDHSPPSSRGLGLKPLSMEQAIANAGTLGSCSVLELCLKEQTVLSRGFLHILYPSVHLASGTCAES